MFTITKNVRISEGDKGSVFKGYALSVIVSLPFFTHGVESNNLTISAHAGHFTTPATVPWTTTALILASVFSALVQSYCIDRWGRKFGIYIVILLQGASCIPLLLEPSEIGSIVLHILSGISTAGLFICIPIYIREISPTNGRGMAIGLITAMTAAGYLVRFGLDGENVLYLIAAMVMVQFVSLFLVVESPSYLVKSGNLEAAIVNMAKLKCLSIDDTYILHEVKLLKEESVRATPNDQLKLSDIWTNRIWRDEMKIGLMLYTITILSGCIIFLDQGKTLIQLKTSADPENILVPICLFAGTMSCVVLVRLFERKYLLTFAYSVMVLSMGTLGVFTQADLTVTSLRWLPVAALGVLVFGYGLAWGLPTMIMVEMLNLQIRSTVLGIIYTYSQIIRLVHVLTFEYLENSIGIYTLFYMFACVNIFGAIYTLSSMPNIKGKSVRQIEKQMKRIPLLNL
ncbi:solute carrier family 2, facilitated glucose transporter member 2-like [Vanessa cardui]|uniref:solute carrier family 2, facilitated glucose transporter member 2-like n=1 Tax=Vanessa cardui TaxID=171605 RepID=UPI001F14092E|nr:solute carrier family 2, facilitated glucose transporter member 2-like [Vanessa cardui]